MADLVSASNAIRTISQTVDIPWGQIMPWLFGTVSVLVVVPTIAYLMAKGVIKGVSFKNSKGSVDINGKDKDESGQCTDTSAEIRQIIKGAVWITNKQNRAVRDIVTAQKDSISSRRGMFYKVLAGFKAPSGFSRIFLVDFEDLLQNTAEFNHISTHVDPNASYVDANYLNRKMSSLGSRYVSTQTELDSEPALRCDVKWSDIESGLREVVKIILYDFMHIAEERKRELVSEIRGIKEGLGVSDAIAEFLDEVAREVDK